ncbi:hypothetical protein Golax_025345, partial [Gossypium laxum]|nr:hypothetical protein [Gossypium laxum]
MVMKVVRMVRLLVVNVVRVRVRVSVVRLLAVNVVRVREVEGKTSGKCKETVLDETESESSKQQFEAKVFEEVDGEGLNYSVGREEDGNKTEYFDSDDHGSILGSEDDDNTDVCRRRTRFPTYNPNSTSPHFCTGML